MKYLTLLTSLLLVTYVFSQDQQSIEKLINFLGEERYESNLASNPGLIENLKDRIEYGCELIDFIPEKASDFKVIEEVASCKKNRTEKISSERLVELYNQGEFNILNYDLPFDKSINYYLKLGQTGKALVIYSQSNIDSRKVR
jgi:hypothetical protein